MDNIAFNKFNYIGHIISAYKFPRVLLFGLIEIMEVLLTSMSI